MFLTKMRFKEYVPLCIPDFSSVRSMLIITSRFMPSFALLYDGERDSKGLRQPGFDSTFVFPIFAEKLISLTIWHLRIVSRAVEMPVILFEAGWFRTQKSLSESSCWLRVFSQHGCQLHWFCSCQHFSTTWRRTHNFLPSRQAYCKAIIFNHLSSLHSAELF